MVSLVTVGGVLAVLSVRQRLNAPSPTGSPRTSRPPSMEKPDSYGLLPELACAKCSVGVGNLNDQLIICGRWSRVGELGIPPGVLKEYFTVLSQIRGLL